MIFFKSKKQKVREEITSSIKELDNFLSSVLSKSSSKGCANHNHSSISMGSREHPAKLEQSSTRGDLIDIKYKSLRESIWNLNKKVDAIFKELGVEFVKTTIERVNAPLQVDYLLKKIKRGK